MKRFGLKSWLGGILATSVSAAIVAAVVSAQPPQSNGRGQTGDGVEVAVKRLMAYDADGNGQLSKAELSDSRLRPLLDRADANQDGNVTKEELTAQLGKEAAALPRGGPAGGPGPGAGGPPPGDRGPGDRGPGNRGPGGPQPGQILPPNLQDELNLTEPQRRDLQELQKEVDARIAKILTAEQQQQLQQMRSRGPGPRGPDGPGGRPPRPQ